MDLPGFLGVPPALAPRPPTTIEAVAEEDVVARIEAWQDHFSIGRLPYWLRYYDRILAAEYETRMAELAEAMKLLDRLSQERRQGRYGGPDYFPRPRLPAGDAW